MRWCLLQCSFCNLPCAATMCFRPSASFSPLAAAAVSCLLQTAAHYSCSTCPRTVPLQPLSSFTHPTFYPLSLPPRLLATPSSFPISPAPPPLALRLHSESPAPFSPPAVLSPTASQLQAPCYSTRHHLSLSAPRLRTHVVWLRLLMRRCCPPLHFLAFIFLSMIFDTNGVCGR
jgi:hypothetical protein